MTRFNKSVVVAIAIVLSIGVLAAIMHRRSRAARLRAETEAAMAIFAPVPAPPQVTAPAPVPPPAAVEAEASRPIEFDADELLKRADRMAARTSRVAWDVDAKAAALAGTDSPAAAAAGPGRTAAARVAAAFAFVRDAVRYEAYAGVLRGAAGAYAARAGNAVDRALLLARLLDHQKIHTRFAIGRLDARDGERLAARIFESVSTRRARSGTAVADSSGTPSPPPPEPAADGLFSRVRARARQDYQVVRTALGDRLPPVTKPSRAEMIAEMNPHVWLQAEVDGRWTDLDPSFADAEIGHSIATLDRTVAEIPPELFQRVHVSVIEEHLANGDAGIERTTRLDVTRNAIDLIDRQIVLSHTEPSTMKGLGFAIAGAAGMQTHNRWTPALTIDGELIMGTSVDLASPAFVSESIEFELLWPGGRREVTRRVLLDRGGAAWRTTRPLDVATLKPIARMGVSGIPSAMAATHVIWFSGGAHNLADFAGALQDLSLDVAIESASAESASAVGEEPVAADGAWPFAMQTFAWMVWTDNVMLPLLNATPGLRLYPDGVRIAMFTQSIDADERVTFISDLRRDDLRGVAAAESSASITSGASTAMQLAEKKLEFGLLQGALEQEALADVARLAGADSATVETTSSTLTREGVVVLAPHTPPSVPFSPHPESAARLAAAAAANHLVVAPLHGLGARGAWWEIAADTGDARAVTDLDLHGGIGPLKANKPSHQNPMGGQRSNMSPYARDQRIKELKELKRMRDRTAIEERAAQGRLRYLQQQAQPQGQRGGGSEYGILVSAVTVVGGFAIRVLGALAVMKMYSEAEEVLDWAIARVQQ